MDSATSSDLNVNYLDNNGKNINTNFTKKETSDTDHYMNLLANTNKTVQESEVVSSLELEDINNNSSVDNSSSVKSSVSSHANFEQLDFNNTKKESNKESNKNSNRSKRRNTCNF